MPKNTRYGLKRSVLVGAVIIGVALVFLPLGLGRPTIAGFGSPEIPAGAEIAREVRLGRGDGFTNPLLDYASASTPEPFLLSLEKEIEGLADDYARKGVLFSLSVYFRDLDNGQWFGINENRLHLPASLLKVPFMLTYLKLAESDETLFHQEVRYSLLSLTRRSISPYCPPLNMVACIRCGSFWTEWLFTPITRRVTSSWSISWNIGTKKPSTRC